VTEVEEREVVYVQATCPECGSEWVIQLREAVGISAQAWASPYRAIWKCWPNGHEWSPS